MLGAVNVMIKTLLVIVISDIVLLAVSEPNKFKENVSSYTIPPPKIEVFTPRGFRISVEDTSGIRLFAFHANVNKEITNLEPGTFYKEVLHPQNGRWIIEDKVSRIHVGDKIYYSVFIIKDGLGYQRDGRSFTVKELLPSPYESSSAPRPSVIFNTQLPNSADDSYKHLTNPKHIADFPSSDGDSSKDLLLCEETILNTTQVLMNYRVELDKLKKLNKLLIMGLNDYPGSKQLKLSGRIPPDGTAVSVVQFILSEKLDLNAKVLWAVRNDNNEIVFEVPSIADKFEIIGLAKERLKNTKFDIQ